MKHFSVTAKMSTNTRDISSTAGQTISVQAGNQALFSLMIAEMSASDNSFNYCEYLQLSIKVENKLRH